LPVLPGLVVVVAQGLEQAAIEINLRVVGLELERLLILGFGLVKMSETDERQARIIVLLREPGNFWALDWTFKLSGKFSPELSLEFALGRYL